MLDTENSNVSLRNKETPRYLFSRKSKELFCGSVEVIFLFSTQRLFDQRKFLRPINFDRMSYRFFVCLNINNITFLKHETS